MLRVVLIASPLLLYAVSAESQSSTSPGQTWSGSWGFASPSDRSLSLQQAQAIRAARASGPSTVNNITYNNMYDNRANYQEIQGIDGDLGSIDFQLNGDRIGQNTNSVGAMNTGTTNIDIVGNANSINATNAADSNGCVDAGISEIAATNSGFDPINGLSLGPVSLGYNSNCTQ